MGGDVSRMNCGVDKRRGYEFQIVWDTWMVRRLSLHQAFTATGPNFGVEMIIVVNISGESYHDHSNFPCTDMTAASQWRVRRQTTGGMGWGICVSAEAVTLMWGYKEQNSWSGASSWGVRCYVPNWVHCSIQVGAWAPAVAPTDVWIDQGLLLCYFCQYCNCSMHKTGMMVVNVVSNNSPVFTALFPLTFSLKKGPNLNHCLSTRDPAWFAVSPARVLFSL